MRRLVGQQFDRGLDVQRLGEDGLIVGLRRLDVGDDLGRLRERVDQFGFDREFHEAPPRKVWRSLPCKTRAVACTKSTKEPALVGTKGTGTSFICSETTEATMGFGKGAVLWLIGSPLPIILLLAIFMHD